MVLFYVGFYETLVEWEKGMRFLRRMVEVVGGR
jgi:hypothetical protein